MKILSSFLGLFFLIGCNIPTPSNSISAPLTDTNSIKTAKPLLFSDCFNSADSSYKQEAIGCSNTYFKVVNDRYVLKIILPSSLNTISSCKEIEIDSSNNNLQVTLIIYRKGDASLANICTDIQITNAPIPLRSIQKCSGKFKLGIDEYIDYYGNMRPSVSILVESLIFWDEMTQQEIKITNELFWKVLDLGFAG